MYLKKLIIENKNEIIRNIEFKMGLNLIIDNTPTSDHKKTGNNVGKTTVLKLIDICFGAEANIAYKDEEYSKNDYNLVKDYLMENETIITLILTEDLEYEKSNEVVIKRNFLQRKKAIRQINGENFIKKDFIKELFMIFYSKEKITKPTFRQLISHYIRYKDRQINKTIKIFDTHVSDAAYESLMLFMLGCDSKHGELKQNLLDKLNQEKKFKQRLEKKQTRNAYQIILDDLNEDIVLLNIKKENLNLNENLENDLDELNSIKYKINKITSSISKMNIRKSLIEESLEDLNKSYTSIDLSKLKLLYSEVSKNISNLQKTFEDLVVYHNQMISQRTDYISKGLEPLNAKIYKAKKDLKVLIEREKALSKQVSKSDTFEDLEHLIGELNIKHMKKGEYETIIAQIDDSNANIDNLENEIEEIGKILFSDDFEALLKKQIDSFNKIFSTISNELYGEKFALKYDKEKNKENGQVLYKFNAFNLNMSTGKKQGEILCFDLAYILFADSENLPCFHFLLNDKKELMHVNQLSRVEPFLKEKKIQLVVSILKDKLTDEILQNAHTAVELSQDDKLFKIEKSIDNILS